jgi:hypothetical protein
MESPAGLIRPTLSLRGNYPHSGSLAYCPQKVPRVVSRSKLAQFWLCDRLQGLEGQVSWHHRDLLMPPLSGTHPLAVCSRRQPEKRRADLPGDMDLDLNVHLTPMQPPQMPFELDSLVTQGLHCSLLPSLPTI